MSRLEEAIEITKKLVKCYSRRVPAFVSQDDLLQEGLIRMLRYLPTYNPDRGVDLSGFLNPHISGAIKDYLRKCDGYKRTQGKTVLISLTTSIKDEETTHVTDIPDPRMNIGADYIATSELSEFLKTASKSLSQRYWLVLPLYYWEDRTFAEIAELLNISEPRVSQIHDSALNKLSGALFSMGIVRVSQLID